MALLAVRKSRDLRRDAHALFATNPLFEAPFVEQVLRSARLTLHVAIVAPGELSSLRDPRPVSMLQEAVGAHGAVGGRLIKAVRVRVFAPRWHARHAQRWALRDVGLREVGVVAVIHLHLF